jgi:hypothetical protein
MTKQPGLDNRHRDSNGEIHRKMGQTRVDTLRKTYGEDFAEGWRGNKKLENLLKDTGANSLQKPGQVAAVTPREQERGDGLLFLLFKKEQIVYLDISSSGLLAWQKKVNSIKTTAI